MRQLLTDKTNKAFAVLKHPFVLKVQTESVVTVR